MKLNFVYFTEDEEEEEDFNRLFYHFATYQIVFLILHFILLGPSLLFLKRAQKCIENVVMRLVLD